MSTAVANAAQQMPPGSGTFINLIDELLNPSLRENALAELSKHREQLPDLAVILWNRFGRLQYHTLPL